MRVLKLHNRQPMAGGVEQHMSWQAEGLQAAGHVVEHRYIETREDQGLSRARAAPLAIWNTEATRLVLRAADEFEPDLVHVHTPFPIMSPAVFVAAHRLGLPVVATSHAFSYSCPSDHLLRKGSPCELCVGRAVKYPAVVNRCRHGSIVHSAVPTVTLAVHRTIGTFARCVDRWVTNTAFCRERMIAEGIPPEKVMVVSPSRPDLGLPLEERRREAVFIGRIVSGKGVETMLAGWRLASLDASLIIIGEGPLESLVLDAASRDPSIRFLGRLDNNSARKRLGEAELLIFPSEWYEGIGNVMIEAFAAGTPVLASDVGNFCEFVTPGANGDHFRSGNPGSLADHLTTFFQSKDRARMRRAARETYEAEFDSEQQIGKLITVYEQALTERWRRRRRRRPT